MWCHSPMVASPNPWLRVQGSPIASIVTGWKETTSALVNLHVASKWLRQINIPHISLIIHYLHSSILRIWIHWFPKQHQKLVLINMFIFCENIEKIICFREWLDFLSLLTKWNMMLGMKVECSKIIPPGFYMFFNVPDYR